MAVQGKEALAGISREELYRAVEDLCVHKMGARLYDRLKGECARHVSQAVAGLVAQQVGFPLYVRASLVGASVRPSRLTHTPSHREPNPINSPWTRRFSWRAWTTCGRTTARTC